MSLTCPSAFSQRLDPQCFGATVGRVNVVVLEPLPLSLVVCSSGLMCATSQTPRTRRWAA